MENIEKFENNIIRNGVASRNPGGGVELQKVDYTGLKSAHYEFFKGS